MTSGMPISLPGAIPGPPPVPILGWRGNLMFSLTDIIGNLVRFHREYGNIYGIARDNAAWVFVFGPEHNHTVLTHPEQFQQLSFILFEADPDTPARRLDAGLITMNGSHHKQQRRLIMPDHAGAAQKAR
jgi:cytochrome P450